MAWDQILPLGIFLIILIVLMLIIRRRNAADSRRPDLARVLCTELGLDFMRGLEARRLNQEDVPMELTGLDRLPPSLKQSLLEDSSWRIEGTYQGVRVAIYDDIRPTGDRFQTFFVIRGYFATPLSDPFRIEKRVSSFRLSPPGFKTGYSFVDGKLKVSGSGESNAYRAFSKDRFIQAAEDLFTSPGSVRIDETGVVWEKKNASLDYAGVNTTLTMVTRAVSAFRE
jgi:hypothetical protein